MSCFLVFCCFVLSPISSSLLFLCLLSLSLSVCVSVWCCVVCGVCRCGRGVVGGRGVCLVCDTLKNRGKPRMWIPTRPRLHIQNVPLCSGTMSTCFSTCARGAGTHGDVLNVHTPSSLLLQQTTHTHAKKKDKNERKKEITVRTAYQNLPTKGYHVPQRFTI